MLHILRGRKRLSFWLRLRRAVFLVPDVGETINGFVTIPSAIAEISMVLYLLVKGVRSTPIDAIDRGQMLTASVSAAA